MLEGNRFAHLIPGNTVPTQGGPTFIPAPPKIPTPSSPPSALEIQKYGTSVSNEAFDQAAKLRTEYAGDQRVKDFLAVTPGYVSALETSPNPQGDMSLIYAFAKMMDPNSVVRESEFATAANTDTLFGQTVARLKKEMGEGGMLREEVRQSLRSEMRRRYDNIIQGYNQARDEYGQVAKSYGLEPDQIIRESAGAPFADDLRDVAARMRGKVPTNPRDPGEMPTTVETDAPKPVLGPDGKPLLEVTIENPMEATEDAKRAEAYKRKQDRFNNRISPQETLLVHGMSGTLSDEAAGVGTGISHLLTGQNPIEGYRTGRDAERLRIADARSQLGGWGTAAEIGGGFLSINPAAAVAPAANALAAFTQGAKGGAAGGALYGFGSGEGFTDSLEKAAIGGGLGAAAGGALSAAAPYVEAGVSRLTQPRGMAPDLAAAAQQEGVRLRRPMFDEGSRIRTGNLESAPGSAPVIQRAMQETAGDIEAAAGRVGGQGNVLETGPAGERVQTAGRRFIQRTKGVADRLYNRARTLAGPGATVTPRESLAQLRRELTDLQQASPVTQGEIDFINEIGEALTQGPLTVDGIRAIRQSVRGRIDEKGLTATQADARAHRILDSLHQDITASLPRDAANAFRRADTYYRERMTHIDDILERFIGNTKAGQPRLSGEQAFRQLKTMASPGGDGRRLAALWRDMSPEEQADVSATIMQAIGRRDADAPFSVDLFLSQVRNLSPSARRTIFGPSGADSINNLVNLSRSFQAAGREINRTKSGTTVKQEMGKTVAAMLVGGGGGAMMGGAGTAGLAAGGALVAMLARTGVRNLSARALMSPRISNWLASMVQATTPGQITALSRRLGVIAAREPALAGELAPIQQALGGQAKPVPLAASETEAEQ